MGPLGRRLPYAHHLRSHRTRRRRVAGQAARAPANARCRRPPRPQRNVEGQTFLGLEAQRDLFKGCVYVQDRHRCWSPAAHAQARTVPRRLRRLRVRHGRRQPTHDAQRVGGVYGVADLRAPMADTICFRPQDPPASIHGRTRAARASIRIGPPRCAAWSGDVSPFLDLLRKLLPDENDRAILWRTWPRACSSQGPQVPMVARIQGVEGNGKTTLSLCVARPSARITRTGPRRKTSSTNLTDGSRIKVFVAVEELQSADSHEQNDVIESLKTTITGARGIQSRVEGRRPSLNGNRRQRHGDDELQNGRA
jgi:hypothetical protein